MLGTNLIVNNMMIINRNILFFPKDQDTTQDTTDKNIDT